MQLLIMWLGICFLGIGGWGISAQAQGWQIIEEMKFDWDGDGKPDTFKLELPVGWNDAGEFTRVTIELSNGKRNLTKRTDHGIKC